MGLAFIIIIRILFAACMVFIIGFVFGSFSKRPVLRTLTKIAAVLAIVLFVMSNVFLMRFGHPGWRGRHGHGCDYDSTIHHRHQQEQAVSLLHDDSR